MKPLTIKDLRDELKIAFTENNKSLKKEVRSDIKSAIEENNEVLMKDVKSEIKSSIKENNEVLVKRIDQVVNSRLTEASDAILHTIDTNHDESNQKFDEVIKKVDKLSTDVKFMHQDLKDIVTEMSNKPSRKQFEEFKSKFDNYTTL